MVYHVRDNGAGFDQLQSKTLFEPFKRLHSDEEYEGTGLGLIAVQRVVEAHGGEVWGEGVEGEGATFFFSLEP